MRLPGNASPVVGSITGISLPLVSTLREKSPLRSSSVGMLRNWLPESDFWRVYSCEAKKKSLLRSLLNLPGM